MTKLCKVYGDAGTGKTTWCINEMINLIQNKGVHENDIGYLTFSRTQANDAKKRIMQQTTIHLKENKNIGTLHSVCTRLLGVESDNYMKAKHKKQFCDLFGVESHYYNLAEKKEEIEQTEPNDEFKGNALIQLYDHCVNFYAMSPTELSDEEIIKVYETTGLEAKFNLHELPFHRFFREYENFKKEHSLFDFVDIIYNTYKQGLVPTIKCLFIDEIQDLGYLMQRILSNFIGSNSIETIYLVGDEKQAIYRYLGANPKWFVDLKADSEIFFEKTYRCPRSVWVVAKKIQSKMKDIKDRDVLDNGEEGLFQLNEMCDKQTVLNKLNEIPKDKKVFVLARTNKMWRDFSVFLAENKFVHQGLRHNTIFTDKLINLNNAIYKITNNIKLNIVEVNYLVNTLPSQPFFEWGSKSKWKKQKEKVELNKEFGIGDLQEAGFIFGLHNYWNEKDYLINNLGLRGDSGQLQKEWLKDNCNEVFGNINVFLGTIHSSKGLDADYVFLFTDSPFKMELTQGELSLWYVGITRAKLGVFCFSNVFDKSISDNFYAAVE